MSKVMVNICCPDHVPTLKEVEERFGLAPCDLDRDFGIIEIDPRQHLFTILVEPGVAERMKTSKMGGGWRVEGPFANLPIAPTGPSS
jgi:hypothetical protein